MSTLSERSSTRRQEKEGDQTHAGEGLKSTGVQLRPYIGPF